MKNFEESKLQQAIVTYLRYNKLVVFSVPNEGQRGIKNARRMKAEGLLKGVCDLIVVLEGKVFFVELKTRSGRLSPSQKDFKRMIESLGHPYLLWRSFDDAENFVKNI